MALLDIRIFPDPILRVRCESYSEFDGALQQLLDDMADTMYHAEGIGLAAPQVGVVHRVAVIDVSKSRDERINLVNPKIVWSAGVTPSEEGCLSIPGYRDSIKRAQEIVLEAQNECGKEFELRASGLLSVCIQHELDHLDGVLFVDRLSRVKRELFRRWIKKQASSNRSEDLPLAEED